MQRAVLSALIVIEVHAKDVAARLIEENVTSMNDFEWISQLRLESTAVEPHLPRSCENSCPPCCVTLSFLLSRGKSLDIQGSKPAGCNLVSCCVVCQAVFIFLMSCSLIIRYYWTRGDLYIRAVNAEFIYGYEYLGNTGRLVITPLTDR